MGGKYASSWYEDSADPGLVESGGVGGRPPICHECAGRGDEDEDAPLCCPACQCDAVNCGKKIDKFRQKRISEDRSTRARWVCYGGDAP